MTASHSHQHVPAYLLCLTLVGLIVLPTATLATPLNETYVARTYYDIDDSGVTSGGYRHEAYHPVTVITPGDGYFTNTYDFQDRRTDSNLYRVVIQVCIENVCETAYTQEYTPPHEKSGEATVKYAFYGSGVERVYVGTNYQLYVYQDGGWTHQEWNDRTEGGWAEVTKIGLP